VSQSTTILEAQKSAISVATILPSSALPIHKLVVQYYNPFVQEEPLDCGKGNKDNSMHMETLDTGPSMVPKENVTISILDETNKIHSLQTFNLYEYF